MPRLFAFLAATTLTALLAACSDAGRLEPTAPAAARGGETTRRIEMLDACDPLSFDAVLGEGACTRSGGLSYDSFIAQLTAKGVTARGRGLMIGIVEKDAASALALARRLLGKGFIVLTGGAAGNVLTLSPPLTIDPALLSAFASAIV